MKIVPAGDAALVVEFGTLIDPDINDEVVAYDAHLHQHPLPGIVELVPTYRSLLVMYDPLQTNYPRLKDQILALEVRHQAYVGEVVEIPVKYGGSEGPDLEAVAAHGKLTVDEVIVLHTKPLYRVYMVGFAPGFPYLGGLDPRLFVPRLQRPRTRIPTGSVAIGGEQTGIYPFSGPGGWLIIGRTPLPLFDVTAQPPARVGAGDRVRFIPVGGGC